MNLRGLLHLVVVYIVWGSTYLAIRVAVREGHGVRDGEWPEAWHFDQVVPFTGDSLDETIQWRHGKTLKAFPSQTLRLHFWMEQAQLFSFWFE